MKKILYLLMLSFLMSACANTPYYSASVGNEKKKSESACLKPSDKPSTVYKGTEEKSFYFTITRTLDTPHSLGLMVVNNGNSFILNVEEICGVEINETRLLSSTVLTKEQMLAIYTLYENIDVSKLDNRENELLTHTDGSSWSLAVVENMEMTESILVSNPGAGWETEESKKLFKLGEYLWDLAKIDGPLY